MASSSDTTCMNRKRDAPGWSDDTDSLGPVCWKCKGTGEKVGKKKHTSTVVCPVCFGAKRVQKKQLKQSRVPTTITTKPKPTNTIGPDFADVPVDLNVEIEEVCHLLGKWRIVQSLRGGHRWSTDDLLTAWVACKSVVNPRSHLDLGCGIGTVLLMTRWFFSDVESYQGVGVEAQKASFLKANKSITMNGQENHLRVQMQDFRDLSVDTLKEAKFDLITGTPPYFPVKETDTGETKPEYGALPTFEQSAPARFEFRGGLEAYIETAARLLKPTGVLCVCEGNLNVKNGLKRVVDSASQNKMRLVRSVFVHGREDKPALFSVHVLGFGVEGEVVIPERFVVRHVGGRRGEAYVKMCLEMGIVFSEE